MSLLIKRPTRILVQGITTTEGRQNTSAMLEYKSEVVAGVSPGRYGQEVMGVPVYDKVSEVIKRHKVDLSVVFVPRNAVVNAVLEAAREHIPLIIVCTEGLSVPETLKLKNQVREEGSMMLGPGSSGIVVPGESKAGFLSSEYVQAGEVAVIARTIGHENRLCQSLYKEELGESIVVSLGGGDIVGTGYVEVLEAIREEANTEVVVIGGELSSRLEEDAARYIQETDYPFPVLAYIFNREANPESAQDKERVLRDAGVTVADDIWEIGQVIKEAMETEEEQTEEQGEAVNEKENREDPGE